MSHQTGPTRDGVDKIERWKATRERVERLKRELNGAECEEANAEIDLARWLLPEDAKPGEQIAVWYGDSLFQATGGSEKITIRTRGKSYEEIEGTMKSPTAREIEALKARNKDLQQHLGALQKAWEELHATRNDPIPMKLHCPGPIAVIVGGVETDILGVCGKPHVDKGEFATKPHHTHACQHCGHVWRPAVVNTVGVRFLPGYKDEAPK